MEYRCPVCDTPQADGEHLANHLAFTALTRGGEHVEWLDEHAPGWGDDSPGELASRVVDRAEVTEHEATDEQPMSRARSTDPGLGGETGSQFDGVVDAAVEQVLDEAQELTKEMFESRTEDSTPRTDDDRASDEQIE